MPAIQNIVLQDSSNNDHTFVPSMIKDGVAMVVESNGIPFGNATYSVGTRQTPSGAFKSTVKLSIPALVTETIDGVSRSKVERTARVEATFSFDPTSTTTERANAVREFASAMVDSKDLFWKAVVGLEGIYR